MLILKAPAKVNLTLKIVGMRDDGYHAIESVFLKLDDFCDTLEFYPHGVDYEILFTSTDKKLENDNNLIIKAANLLRKKSGVFAGARIHLNKRIPIEAGLGGGSSNAAITLVGLNQLWKLNFSERELMEIGAVVGSDVPFFISSENCAVVTGRGEYVTPFSVENAPKIVVKKGELGLPTKLVFQQFQSLSPNLPIVDTEYGRDGATLELTNEMKQALILGDKKRVGELLANDLELPALHFLPEIEKIKHEILEQYDAYGTLMTGSGSAIFGVLKD